jgi:DNA processing protein
MELKGEDRRRLVEQCRNKLNQKEILADESKAVFPASEVNSNAKAILRALKHDAPVGLDALVEAIEGLDPSEIIAGLFELELGGLVRQLPGKSYIKVWAE